MYKLKSREALNDCKLALKRYRENEETELWRVDWCATLTLLRAVGNILEKVDGRNCNAVKNTLSEYWKSSWSEDEIYSKFIRLERNLILKEFDFNVKKEGGQLLTRNGQLLVNDSGQLLVTPRSSKVSDGPYKGRCPAEVVEMAIDWWNEKLSLVEDQIAQEASSASDKVQSPES
ncbi:MAG: hypothetical protein AAF950_17150 [Pseudomonadota bacterium]